jgi:hypothetical protein
MKKNIIISFLSLACIALIVSVIIYYLKYQSRNQQVLKYEYINNHYEEIFKLCSINDKVFVQKYKKNGFEIIEKGDNEFILREERMQKFNDLYGFYFIYDNDTQKILEFSTYKP